MEHDDGPVSDDLVVVRVVSDPYLAEMIKNQLNAEGIRCFVGGGNQGGFVGLSATEIQILVRAVDADRAAKVLEESDRRSDEELPSEDA
jgi:hypothetical protein